MIKNSEHKAENMQKIYRRTPMSKLQSNFTDITLRHGYSGVDLLHILRTPFPKNLSLESSFYPQFLHADWSYLTFILCFYILYIKWQPSQHLLHGFLYPKYGVSIVDFQHVLNFVNAGWEGTDEIILER